MKTVLVMILVAFMSVAAHAQHSVALSWSAGATGTVPTGYNVKRGTIKGGPYVTITSQAGKTYTDNSAAVQAEGSTFYYVTTATAGGLESLASNEIVAVIPITPTAPVPPVLNPPVIQ
jgi:fibronectin type 3 domain-containing protein